MCTNTATHPPDYGLAVRRPGVRRWGNAIFRQKHSAMNSFVESSILYPAPRHRILALTVGRAYKKQNTEPQGNHLAILILAWAYVLFRALGSSRNCLSQSPIWGMHIVLADFTCLQDSESQIAAVKVSIGF